MYALYAFVSWVGEYCRSFPLLQTGVSWKYKKEKENSILAQSVIMMCLCVHVSKGAKIRNRYI